METKVRRAAYENLVRTNAHRLYVLAHRLTGDSAAAQALVEETCTRAWKRIGSLRDVPAARQWLVAALLEQWSGSEPHTVPGGADVAATTNVQAVLDRLEPARRAALLLVAIERFSCAEAARVLGDDPDAVATRVDEACASLATRLPALSPAPGGNGNGNDDVRACRLAEAWHPLLADVAPPADLRRRLLAIASY